MIKQKRATSTNLYNGHVVHHIQWLMMATSLTMRVHEPPSSKNKGKSLYHPLIYGGGLHNPQPMKRSISPPKLSNTSQITP